MTGLLVGLLRLGGSVLRGASYPFLLIGLIATPILSGARWCDRRADEKAPPEWNPRLWQRNHDPRSEEQDRRS